MAKMHSSGKGRSGSVKPYATAFPTWLTKSVDEIKSDVIQMGNKGVPAPDIGTRLRDEYGIGKASDVLGESITRFLQRNGVVPKIPHDLESLVHRANTLRSHLNIYRKDNSAKYRLILVSSRMYRVARYYKRKMRIPGNWKPKLVELNK
ncbi:40S RIBOSOMAL PROTEIN S13 [Encephalitozoon cuniculi GB-M1]|uniref:Small ribosomal subunit protein uS15 n=2 Tax=Encephalitozoon cuniculi TaxID=6035 RepID=RS13_ENCCU|nr:ribosomal 40S subunit protein S13 [Encephalitozoon cuniculi GB-M1]Q8SRB3.1 RecName: Full=Small ribosomal subunit protein uS15; AltName: Full=40S ribosomal protein S13 [Encephalitozoon cuniculi GB-M1]7QEP_C3 Chain C3, 40S ribosomal protein S13 [Encephalitozoon cuniculi GB-M1]AGE95166.1 40S ribosomal protein S13 [Encephalitozoon cuniculi]KMV65635.1 40S ribosomal protein S13 [Encephalitozoon cuniculi EcunIII-L]UYI27037.1 ribosomal protein S15 [Encephalitozoon cuniculi]CAD26412.1 40S RIBOSOMAL